MRARRRAFRARPWTVLAGVGHSTGKTDDPSAPRGFVRRRLQRLADRGGACHRAGDAGAWIMSGPTCRSGRRRPLRWPMRGIRGIGSSGGCASVFKGQFEIRRKRAVDACFDSLVLPLKSTLIAGRKLLPLAGGRGWGRVTPHAAWPWLDPHPKPLLREEGLFRPAPFRAGLGPTAPQDQVIEQHHIQRRKPCASRRVSARSAALGRRSPSG